MLVKDFMTPNVLTISEDKSMLEARELMKSSAFRRIPVVDDIKRVMGIITDGDVGRTSPSDASTLSRYEANYLLSRLKVRDVMTRDVILCVITVQLRMSPIYCINIRSTLCLL